MKLGAHLDVVPLDVSGLDLHNHATSERGMLFVPNTGQELYAGTGNPMNKSEGHAYTSAIVKVDVDEDRPDTFGTIVDSDKGDRLRPSEL